MISAPTPNVIKPDRHRVEYVPTDPLLSAAEAAAELGIGRSTFWRCVADGHLPPPLRVTARTPRWRRSELLAAIARRST